MGWMKKMRGARRHGRPLGKTKRVTASGVAGVRNEVTGYTIVEAESHDAAAAMLDGHPHPQNAWRVYRCAFGDRRYPDSKP